MFFIDLSEEFSNPPPPAHPTPLWGIRTNQKLTKRVYILSSKHTYRLTYLLIIMLARKQIYDRLLKCGYVFFFNSGRAVHCLVWNNLADVLDFDFFRFVVIFFICHDHGSGCGSSHCTDREPHRNLPFHSSSQQTRRGRRFSK